MVGNIDAIAGALPLCGILTFLPDISGEYGWSESRLLGILMRSQVLFLCVESWLCLILVVNTDKIRCQYYTAVHSGNYTPLDGSSLPLYWQHPSRLNRAVTLRNDSLGTYDTHHETASSSHAFLILGQWLHCWRNVLGIITNASIQEQFAWNTWCDSCMAC